MAQDQSLLLGGPVDGRVYAKAFGKRMIFVPVFGPAWAKPFAQYELIDTEECKHRLVYEFVPPTDGGGGY